MNYLLDESADELRAPSVEYKPVAERLALLKTLEAQDRATVIRIIDALLNLARMRDHLQQGTA
jgi:hypothetical protein